MSLKPWHIAVLIPARNEEQLLPRCLESLQIARLNLPLAVTSDVIVVADSCSDRTFDCARDLLGDTGVVLRSNAGNVGRARSLAARAALRRHAGATNLCWLANTDADCEIPPLWLTHHLAVAEKGFAAVAGTVDVDSFSEHTTRVKGLFRRTYLIHPDGSHPHVHGANLGVRADAYLRVGGWMNLETAEDHDLWNRLHRAGDSRLSDARLQVITSGRRVGRAPLGFAGALAAHNGTAA